MVMSFTFACALANAGSAPTFASPSVTSTIILSFLFFGLLLKSSSMDIASMAANIASPIEVPGSSFFTFSLFNTERILFLSVVGFTRILTLPLKNPSPI